MTNISLGEKIKHVRVAKHLSQENLARDVELSVSTISRIERGLMECNGDSLIKIKKALGIENAPLIDDEAVIFKERLYMWYDLIMAERLNEAHDMKTELSVIEYLPFEQNLVTLYSLFNIELILIENNISVAEEKLNTFQSQLDEMSAENLYHYHFCKGSLNLCLKHFEEALAFYLKAFDMKDTNLYKEDILCFNIAFCYSKLGLPIHAIRFAKNACMTYNNDRLNLMGMYLNDILAVNYIRIRQLHIAKGFLDKCYEQARYSQHRLYIGMSLHNYGCLYREEAAWENAVNYFDLAFNFLQKGDDLYLENLYQKIYCLIMGKKYIRLKDQPHNNGALDQAISISEEDEKYLILFKSLDHLLTLKEKDSSDYIETVTIPYLISIFDGFKALDYCKLLEQYYFSVKRDKKTLLISSVAGNIYERIVLGGQ